MGVWRREPPPRSPSPSRLLLAALVLLARHLQSETFELLPGTEEEVLLKAQGLPSGGGEAAAAAEEASPCEDEDEQCDDWAADGRCGELPDKCRRSCGFCEANEEPTTPRKHGDKWMCIPRKETKTDLNGHGPDGRCFDRYPSCEAWAAIRWCLKDPGFMQEACPDSCCLCSGPAESRAHVQELHGIFTGERIYGLPATDRDRNIPGIDPVFKQSRADITEIIAEPASVLDIGYGRKGSSSESRKTRGFRVRDIHGDFEQLEAVARIEPRCIDWHPACGLLMLNGECFESPYEMSIMCRASCGLCWAAGEDWELVELEPVVNRWFQGAREERQAQPPLPSFLAGVNNTDRPQGVDGAQGQRQSEGKKPGGGHEHGGHGRGGGHGRKGKREEKGGGKPPPPPPPATRHSFLDGCMDGKPDDCKEKATGKFCLTHAAEMAAKCRESCGLCRRTRVPHPPRDRDLLPDSQGRPYPSVGLSVNGMEENTQQLVSLAIAAGVQRFEASLSSTANEGTARLDLLGEAVRGSKRAPYIVLIVDPRGYGATLRAVMEGVRALGTGYVDMAAIRVGPRVDQLLLQWSWQALEKLYFMTVVNALGGFGGEISSYGFLQRHTAVPFSVIQRPVDPFMPDRMFVDTSLLKGFTYVGHNIMGGSWLSKGMVSGLPTINNTALTSLSQRVNRSVLLICVRWALQRGLAVTVSMDEVRLEEIPLLLEVFAFELADREMAVVDALEYTLPENSVRKEMGKEVHGDPKREEQPKRVRDGGGGAARDIPARAAKDRGPPAQEGGQQQQQERRPGKPPRGSTHATKQ